MSHFVSRSGADFDSLQHQLLRREPLSPEDTLDEQDESRSTTLPTSDPANLGISSSLAARRRREVSDYEIASLPTTPGFSRRNSPELPDLSPGPPRPRSVAGSISASGTGGGKQQEASDYFQAARRPSSVAGPLRTSRSPSERRSSRAQNGKDGPLSSPGSDARPGSAGSESSSTRSRRSSRSNMRSRKVQKGVSFSDKRAGPGEPGHDHRSHYGRVPRSNSGNIEPLRQSGVNPHFVRGKSSGMISAQEMAPRKLGTWDGVFMPVSLNILGIILFLRFGFILGQAGLLGSLFLLTASYAIDTLTAMSLNAISTNGQVRGGGAYYLISRSLGPEFGGSIGLIFFAGQALNAAMNVLGFVESLTDAFGESRSKGGFLPEGPWFSFFYGSAVLLLSTIVCLVGSRLFARATLVLALILGLSILSIPISSLVVQPFVDDERGAYYTGWSLQTLRENLLPNFTSGAAGSSTGDRPESWQSVFGVLFPAVTGILAGASMSGDLRKPSKSIPKGTNWSLLFTYVIYVGSFVVFAGTIQRESFYVDVGIVSDVAMSPQIITFGTLAATAFSALMGVMACGKVLQAISRDNLLPILNMFAQGTEVSDTPTYAVLFTWIFCQLILFVDSVNMIAQLVTMTTLLTFGTLSFATCALKAGGAPSFRPSFRYWNIWTAGGGALTCFGAMFFTNALAASACIVLAIFLFVAINFFSPPKPWGDVTRNLTYHFVRKYLLRLDERKGHVKYWRPQILLLANNPRKEWNLIIFCNSLKKGALYVLGHVLKGEFTECLAELRKQQIAWLKLVDITGIKSFVDVVIANDEREGARNLILSCGLGGMRPNIVVMGYPSDMHHPARSAAREASPALTQKSDSSEITIRGLQPEPRDHMIVNVQSLPTDSARRETPIKATTYVGIMEDSLALNKALAIAYGFDVMQLPGPASSTKHQKPDQDLFIDLWPIQIASPDADESHAWDTYTMVLQLGTILSLTGTWKSHKLRVSVFVENEWEIEDERKRVRSLLDNLRIPASLRVFSLDSGSILSYQSIVLGRRSVSEEHELALKGDPWWEALKQLRKDEERRARAAAKRKSQPPAQAIPNAPSETRKQTKREQRLLGVSLPAEHLAFYKQNIRLGLAHPRSRLRGDGESDVDSDDSDDSSLEDELALLSEDDEWFGNGKGGLGLRRSSTISGGISSGRAKYGKRPRSFSLGGSSGLPDDPISRPLLSTSTSTTSITTEAIGGYGSLSSSQRTATPETVREEAARRGQGVGSGSSTLSDNTPRGSYLANGKGLLTGRPETLAPPLQREASIESDREATLKASDRNKIQAKLSAQNVRETLSRSSSSYSSTSSVGSHGSDMDADLDLDLDLERDDRGGRSISSSLTARSAIGKKVVVPKSRQRQSSISSLYGHGRARSEEGAAPGDAPSRRRKDIRHVSAPNPTIEADPLAVSFNELPNKAQYLILNELIRVNSSAATSVVLTALPAPEPGTSQDELKSHKYLEQLESLFTGGPPVLGVHAKTLTMTMSL